MRRTRRNFLAALGGTGIATLAGCTTVLDGGGDDRPELDVAALRGVERLGTLSVPVRTPTPIAPWFLEESDSRARAMLASVPEEMDSAEVPNEAVRRIYADAREDAARYLERAGTAKSPYERLRTLRAARGSAAMAKGTYEAAIGELDGVDVRSEVESVRSAVESFRSAHRYLGDEPGPTLVVHTDIEQFAAAATRYLGHTTETGRYAESAPRVGEMFDELESARASLAAARHFSERYRASLSDPQEFGDVFQQSASWLVGVVEDRRDEYPDDYGPDNPLVDQLDRDLDDTPARDLLTEAFAHLHFRVDGARAELRRDRIASALLEVHAAERNRRALEAAISAVRNGAFGAPQSASAVRETKLAALQAVESARSTSVYPSVTRRTLTDVSHRLGQGDSYLERSLETDTYRSARNAMGQYAYVQFVAREAPETSAWVLGAVNAARDEPTG
ncbi:hypothetical protein GJR99_16040 [Haloferax sp. MBLA0078]|uniref:Uncharacterized protein n=2 Tax=Haloferacaceae TaxID=1644056 RepID=A0A6A8GBZ6_9EURY|nr:hypothetical protein [Haloferax sp. CBA1150]KAB1191287.1 hypothetical protein Hfx1150_16045 [Haloferax sp. CBA1150]MRW98078.1 hypothetical protein [Haloferax marinum]